MLDVGHPLDSTSGALLVQAIVNRDTVILHARTAQTDRMQPVWKATLRLTTPVQLESFNSELLDAPDSVEDTLALFKTWTDKFSTGPAQGILGRRLASSALSS